MNRLFKITLFFISFIPANNSLGCSTHTHLVGDRIYAEKHEFECPICDDCENACQCPQSADDYIEEFLPTKFWFLSSNELSMIHKTSFVPMVYGMIWQPPKIK